MPEDKIELYLLIKAPDGAVLFCRHPWPRKVIRQISWAALALLLQIPASLITVASASDFSHPKQTYVPPSFIDRRMDFSLLREHQALEGTNAKSPAAIAQSKSAPAPHHKSVHRKPGHKIATAGKHPHGPPPKTVAAARRSPALPPSSLATNQYQNIDLTKASKALRQRLHNIATSPATAKEVAKLRTQADTLMRSGQFNEAKHTLAKILQLTPHDKQMIRQLGAISVERAKQLSNSQQTDEAIRYARQALLIDGNNSQAHKVLNGLLLKAGENPRDINTRIKNAELLAAQGRNDEAALEYNAALKLHPSAEAYIGLGNIAMRSHQYEKARNAYQLALETEPNSAAAHKQLGLFKYNTNDIVGANSELSRALILNPNDQDSAKTLVDLWQRQVSHIPSANSHLGLARAYQLSGDLNSAQNEYRTVVRMDPANPHLPAARQSFKLALNRQQAARAAEAAHTLEGQGALSDAYEKVIEAQRLSPGDAELRVYQGHLLEQLQNNSAARRAYLDALKLDPRNVTAAARLKALPSSLFASGDMLASALSSQSMPQLASGVPHDPVIQLSNFATQLRNQMITQKNQQQGAEDKAHDIISHIGAPPEESSVHSLDAAGGSAGGSTGGALSQAAIDAIAGSAGAGATGTTAGAVPLSNSVSSTLASAASALAAAREVTGSSRHTTAAHHSAASRTSAATSRTSGSFSSAPAAPTTSDSFSSAPAASTTSGSFNSAPTANAYSSFNSAPVSSTSGSEQIPPMAPSLRTAALDQTLDSALQAPSPSWSVPNASSVNNSSSYPATNTNSSLIAAASQFQAQPPLDRSSSAMPSLRPSMQPVSSVVKLSLEAANAKMTGVELSVILRNDMSNSLVLPAKPHAIIKYSNRREAEVRVSFTNNTVPAHGEIRGIIKVPFDKVDPTADLFIPALLPPGTANRDVHLTTSMALR